MRHRKLKILALCACLEVPLAADSYPRQPFIDAEHYVFRLTLQDDTNEISGEATIAIRFTRPAVTGFVLDLASPVGNKGMTVSSVTSNGAEVHFTHAADRLRITIPDPPASGELCRYTIRYRGTPASGLLIANNKYGERTFFGLNWPDKARQWLPMIDHPYDKATSEFIVTAPAYYQVVANGLLQEETDLPGGLRLTHWKQSVPISSWLNMIGVARFTSRHLGTTHGIPLETWVYPRDRQAGITIFDEAVRQAIEFYSDTIGPYPYEKLGNIEAAGLQGGTEHASAIAYGEASVNGKRADGLVAHEIAHQWFGDSVTEKDWDDVWLSEGFATYLTLLFTEHYQGRDAFVQGLRRSRENIFELQKKLPGVTVQHDNLSDMNRVLNQLIYQKGGWTLHMLRTLVGDENFQAGLRQYYGRYRDSNASTQDFRRTMEETSGLQLESFFDQWLRRPGWPVIEGAWRYNATTKKVEIDLKQTQPGPLYNLSLDLRITRVETIQLSAREQHFEVAEDKEPASVTFDPETRLLAEVRVSKAR